MMTVMALHSAGDLLAWHYHLHSIVPAGALLPDGSFLRLWIDAEKLRDRSLKTMLTI